MVIDFFVSNIMTFMIVSAVIIVMIINRNIRLPAAELFTTGIVLLLICCLKDFINAATGNFADLDIPPDIALGLRTLLSVISYTLRPVIILTELCIIVTQKKYHIPLAVPAAINALIYSTALFGSKLAFYYDDDLAWHRGKLGGTVFIVQILYMVMLLYISAVNFKKKNTGKSVILIAMVIQSLIASLLELNGSDSGIANAVTALCILEYYIYLTLIYQQEVTDTLLIKQLEISEAEMQILRNQIQPHFIYNTLTIIRSLVRTDSKKAIEAINSFSKYLRTHINTIQEKDLISFEDELKNVLVYLELAQADYPGKIDMICDLKVKDFRIPPLSLEPIVENAIQHGISRKGGRITISTFTEKEHIVIKISDDGTAKKDLTQKAVERLGVGLENTRKRIELHCGGSMKTEMTDKGCIVTIMIPNRREHNEDTDS